MISISRQSVGLLIACAVVTTTVGCHSLGGRREPVPVFNVPKELEKTTHPTYVVEAPDVLLIEGVKGVPKGPHTIESLDVLGISLGDPLPNAPLNGLVTVDTEGRIDLGPVYGGMVTVVGRTIPEATAAIEQHLAVTAKLKAPRVILTLAQTRSMQRVSGANLVQPDGTINLGTYGSVQVAGLTVAEVKRAVEAQLSTKLQDPEVAVAVQGFNSKVVYVVLDGGGAGQTITLLPCTGNETVLDAIAKVSGLSAVSSTQDIWVARPGPAGTGCQRLPVNWDGVVCGAETSTNYQLMPGDRVYVAAQRLVTIDTHLARIIAPVERLLGVTLLGSQTVRSISGRGIRNSGIGGF